MTVRWGVVTMGLALGAGAAACGATPSADPIDAIAVPTARGAIAIDGDLGERDWSVTSAVRVFTADGEEARPSSQVRVLRDDASLYVALYAADEDIRSSDGFDVRLGALALRLDPRGGVAPAVAGLRAAAEADGTIDDPDDWDEEWVVEAAIPLAALGRDATGGATIDADLRRCDTPKDGHQRCGGWTGELTLR